MSHRVFIILSLFISALSAAPTNAADSPFPSYIKICPRNEKAWQCILENIERCRPHLDKGIPKLGIPSLHPFVVPKLEITSKEFGFVLFDVKVYNLDKIRITRGSIDFDNYTFSIDCELPFLVTKFRYEASGSILSLNFKGDGFGYVNATDVLMRGNLTGHPQVIDGKEYIDFQQFDLDYSTENGTVFFPKLFPNKDELTARTNKLINENYKQFAEELRPYVAESVGELLKMISKNVFSKIPYDVLFPIVDKE